VRNNISNMYNDDDDDNYRTTCTLWYKTAEKTKDVSKEKVEGEQNERGILYCNRETRLMLCAT